MGLRIRLSRNDRSPQRLKPIFRVFRLLLRFRRFARFDLGASLGGLQRLAIESIHRQPARRFQDRQRGEDRRIHSKIALTLLIHTGRKDRSIDKRSPKTRKLWRVNTQIFGDRPERQ